MHLNARAGGRRTARTDASSTTTTTAASPRSSHPTASLRSTVFRAARALGRQIPRDLSLVAFDDADWTSVTTPAVTVMAQPIHEIGAEAARLLLRRIGGDGAPPVTRVLEQHLIERESVAPFAVP